MQIANRMNIIYRWFLFVVVGCQVLKKFSHWISLLFSLSSLLKLHHHHHKYVSCSYSPIPFVFSSIVSVLIVSSLTAHPHDRINQNSVNAAFKIQNLSSSLARIERTLFNACELRLIVAVSISTNDLDNTFGVWCPVTLFDLVNVPWPFVSIFVFVPVALVPLPAPLLNDEWRFTLGRSSLVGRLEYWLGNESKHGEPMFLMSRVSVRFFMYT